MLLFTSKIRYDSSTGNSKVSVNTAMFFVQILAFLRCRRMEIYDLLKQ